MNASNKAHAEAEAQEERANGKKYRLVSRPNFIERTSFSTPQRNVH